MSLVVGLFGAYNDLKKAFDSVRSSLLLEILRHGNSDKDY